MVADIIDIVNKNLKGEKIRGADIAVLIKNTVVSVAGGPIIGVIMAVIEGLLAVLGWYRNTQLHVFNGYQVSDLPYKSVESSALSADMQRAAAGAIAKRSLVTTNTNNYTPAATKKPVISIPTQAQTNGANSVKDFWSKHSQKIMGGLGVAAILLVLFSYLKSKK